MADIFYNEITTESNKKIKIYDNLFDLKFRQIIYDYIDTSMFRIGWSDGPIIENRKHRFLHAAYLNEEIENIGFYKKIKNTPIEKDIEGLEFAHAVANLSTPSDSNFVHTHPEKIGILYYANLEWLDGWHGETIFYDETGKDIIFASAYTPGRIIVFDGSIPHAIRPQSSIATKFRFTLSLFFNEHKTL
jgi:hypothetical protein